MIHVQFADETESEIVSFFACSQDPEVYDHLGQVEANDPRWHEYYAKLSAAGMPLFGIPEPVQETD